MGLVAAKPIERFVKRQIADQGGWPRILDRIASGETVLAISRTLYRPDSTPEALKPIDRSTLSNMLHQWCRRAPENQAALDAARTESGSAHAETAVATLEDAAVDRDSIQKARVVADGKFRYAGFMDRQQFGERTTGVNVTLNVASLHVDALRHRVSSKSNNNSVVSPAGSASNGEVARETQVLAVQDAMQRIAAPEGEPTVSEQPGSA